MSNEIFQEIYEISLLNLYIYTDCAILMTCPGFLKCKALGTGIDEKIHQITYAEFMSPERITSDEQKKGYPLWQEQIANSVKKIDHKLVIAFYETANIMITIKNRNLFVTFRGTCNLDESLLDIEILLKSHISGVKPKVDNLTLFINSIFEQVTNAIKAAKHMEQCDNIIFSGHSLGAIICAIFVMRIVKHHHECIYNSKTGQFSKYFMCLLGMPSIRDDKFANEVDALIGDNYINICNNGDLMMKASSALIPHLNNVIQYETSCEKTVHVNLGDNKLTNLYNSYLELFMSSFKFFKFPEFMMSSMISHSILKYVENIYLFTQNTSTDKLKLTETRLTAKFKNIFKNMHKILEVKKPYTLIAFKGGHNKSQKKINKTRKSKRRN